MTTTKKAVMPKVRKMFINFNLFDNWIDDIDVDDKASSSYDYSIEVVLPPKGFETNANVIGSVTLK